MSTISSASSKRSARARISSPSASPACRRSPPSPIMSEDQHPATPRSMTLMAGPIDPRESPTAVNEFAVKKSLAWFEHSVISRVPARYRGARPAGLSGLPAAHRLHGHEHGPPPQRPSQALRPSRAGRDCRGREDQDLLRRVFRRSRPHRGVLSRDHRPDLPARPSSRPAISPIAAARSIPARSATRRC